MIQVDSLHLVQGRFELRDVSFTVDEGCYAVLMGATGSGKTSVLEAVCGLRPMRAGTVRIGNRDVTRAKPAERGIGYVPQESALFNTMTVRDNIGFSLAIRHWDRARINDRVEELAAMLNIAPLLDRSPAHLSGGEKQRVALGRALAFRPATLLLDEPLSALDEETRARMEQLLKKVQQRTAVTTLHITHSRPEAERMADVLIRIDAGRFHTFRNPHDD